MFKGTHFSIIEMMDFPHPPPRTWIASTAPMRRRWSVSDLLEADVVGDKKDDPNVLVDKQLAIQFSPFNFRL